MKKLASVLCTVVLLLCVLAVPASAAPLEYWEKPGSWLWYYNTHQGEKEIEYPLGDGWLFCIEYSDHILIYDARKLSGDVVIPERINGKPVTTLFFTSYPTGDGGVMFEALAHSSLKEVTSFTLPATLTELTISEDSYVSLIFRSEKLKEVIFLGDGPEVLPGGCISSPVLERVVLPKKVKKMDGAFPKVKEIVIDPDNPYFVKDEQGVIYNKDKTRLVTAAEGAESRTELTIPDTVTEVAPGAISPNAYLQKIYGGTQIKKFAEYEFSHCDQLNPFGDTYGHWGEEYVKWAYDKKWMYGTGALSFSPDDNVTRGMLAAVLYRLEGTPITLWGSPFPDVPANSYYAKAIRWASDNGVAYGYSEKQFAPKDNVTREQMACMLYRYAKLKGEVSPSAALDEFTDADRVHDWSQEAMRWAVGEGIISGMGNGKLNPRGTATRAEVAVVLKKLSDLGLGSK